MSVTNTTIQIKKSLVSGNSPSVLASGELAINAADDKLFYAKPGGSISYITNQQSFATVNANSSLLLASSSTDTLTLVPGTNITITACTATKTITFNSTAEAAGGTLDQYARDTANSASANTIYNQGVNVSQNTRLTTVEANTIYLLGALNQTNTNIGLSNTQLKSYTDGAISSANTQVVSYIDGQISYVSGVNTEQNTRISTVEANTVYLFGAMDATNTNITNANTQLKSYTDGLVSTSVSSANTQLKSYTDGAISSANTQLKSYVDGQISYNQSINDTQNTRISTVEANTVYLFGALDATNNSITSANTQLKSYTDGLVSSSVSSANTQLKSYTDGAISSANTQLKSYTDGVIASSNTQVVSYIDGQISYVNNINNTQNTNITTATNLAQGAYDTANLKFNTSGGNITGDVIVSANVTITGNLTVAGNVTTVSANNLIITDNMIYLNDNNQVTNPDLGFAGNYNDGIYRHTGFFRDASDGYWKVYDQYLPEPDASPYIDTSNSSFRIADFQANNVTFGKITTSSSQLVTNLNADYLNGQHGSYYAVASEQNGINATQNTNITNTQTWLDANIAYISGVNIAQNSSIVNANTQLKSYTDGLVSSSVSSANTQLKSYTDGAISSAVSSANTQLKSYTDGAISSSVSSANTQLKAYTDGQISYISGVDIAQNSRISTVEANTVYLFGALNQTNTNIVSANTQLRAYTDGAIASANTQLKSYTDGAISSAVSSDNTQLKAYTDGQLSANLAYSSGVNTSQNTSISALQTLANTDVTSITISSGTYGGTTNVAVVTVAANGRITAISNTLISSGATITDDNTSNATRYLMLGQSTSGSYTVANTSSSKLTFNPSTGALSATSFVGAAAAGTLSGTTLASGVTASSLTSVGTITSGTWSGSFGAVSGANLTGLTAGNLSGTIPSAVLGNSTHYVGTTAIALNRASASQTLTGVSIDGNAATATNVAWSGITSKPTTVSGYGITNALVRGGAIGSIDFNAQRTLASGIYSVDAAPTNGPAGGSAYSNFIQMYERGDTAAQLVIEYSTGRMYSRGIQTAVPTYSPWRTQLDDGNYTSYAMPAGASATNSVDVRAPIFYDSNNTGYYIDPNGITNLGGVNDRPLRVLKTSGVNSTCAIFENQYGDNSWGIVGEFRVGSGSGSDRASILFSNGYDTNTWSAGFGGSDSSYFRIRYDHGHRNSGWGIEAIAIDRSSNLFVNGSCRSPIFYDSNDTGYYVNPNSISQFSRVNANDYIYSSNQMYSTITYDTNDTGYYCDPNSTSRFNSAYFIGAIASGTLSADYSSAAIEVREYAFGGVQTDSWSYAPRIGFHWGGRVASQIAMGSNGWIQALNNPGNANENFQAANIYATGNVTAYYSDKRLKTIVGKITNAIEKVKSIETFKYVNNEIAKEYGFESQEVQIGVSAQSVEKVLPEIVKHAPFDFKIVDKDVTSKSGEWYKTVQYDKLIPLLIEAIKDQQTQIETLSSEIKELNELKQKLKDNGII